MVLNKKKLFFVSNKLNSNIKKKKKMRHASDFGYTNEDINVFVVVEMKYLIMLENHF